jgi:hypothetical protein
MVGGPVARAGGRLEDEPVPVRLLAHDDRDARRKRGHGREHPEHVGLVGQRRRGARARLLDDERPPLAGGGEVDAVTPRRIDDRQVLCIRVPRLDKPKRAEIVGDVGSVEHLPRGRASPAP